MTAARARYIPALLQRHLDDLAFVAGQRRAALTSRRHTLREFGELNERLEAHLQGVMVAPAAEVIDRLQPQLAAVDRDEAFAAGHVLLRLANVAATRAVVIEFSRARGQTLAGLRDALSMAPPAPFADEMRSALLHAKPATAGAAAVVLASQRLLDAASPRLAALLQDEDVAVSALAWQAAWRADVAGRGTAPARPFVAGVAHDAPAVRSAAWCAVAWTGQAQAQPLLSLLRQRAAAGDAVALHWLAVLGDESDAPLLLQAVLALGDSRLRCDLLGRFGHPSALNALLRWMGEDDVAQAVAAREAFTRITGQDIRGARRQLPVPDDADEFDREMAPDIWMPDIDKAHALLKRHGEHWATGIRWCQGHRLDVEVSRELLLQLDLEARWEVAARAALAGHPVSAPPPIV